MAVRTGIGGLRPEGFAKSIGAMVCSTLAINVLALVLPITTLQIYDRVLPNQSIETLNVLIIGVIVVLGLDLILKVARSYLIGFSGAAYTHRLSTASVERMLNTDTSGSGQSRVGESLNNLAAIGSLKEFHNGQFLTTVIEFGFVPVILLLIYYIGGPLVWVPMVTLVIFALIALLNGLNLKRALKGRDELDDGRFNFFIDGLGAVHSIKAMALERLFERRYEKLQSRSCEANHEVAKAISSLFSTASIFTPVITVVTITIGATLAVKGDITVGALIAIVLLANRLMPPVQRGLMLWARFQDFRNSQLRVKNFFNSQTADEDYSEEIPAAAGVLELKGVSYSHSEEAPALFDNLNLKIERGEFISVSGDYGAGKSTLLRLLAGIHRPTGGEILLDGLDIARYPSERLAEHLGLIDTEGVIFRGTIRENLTRFSATPLTQAMYVASLLGVDEDIAALPGGMDTKLTGTNADTIPPGLKQRIAMVRVLATKPKLILFDNADRALDRHGYVLVHRFFARLKGKATVILVTDDFNLQSIADRSLWLEGRQIVEKAKEAATDLTVQQYREVRL